MVARAPSPVGRHGGEKRTAESGRSAIHAGRPAARDEAEGNLRSGPTDRAGIVGGACIRSTSRSLGRSSGGSACRFRAWAARHQQVGGQPTDRMSNVCDGRTLPPGTAGLPGQDVHPAHADAGVGHQAHGTSEEDQMEVVRAPPSIDGVARQANGTGKGDRRGRLRVAP
jgi:hypothetical protein